MELKYLNRGSIRMNLCRLYICLSDYASSASNPTESQDKNRSWIALTLNLNFVKALQHGAFNRLARFEYFCDFENGKRNGLCL